MMSRFRYYAGFDTPVVLLVTLVLHTSRLKTIRTFLREKRHYKCPEKSVTLTSMSKNRSGCTLCGIIQSSDAMRENNRITTPKWLVCDNGERVQNVSPSPSHKTKSALARRSSCVNCFWKHRNLHSMHFEARKKKKKEKIEVENKGSIWRK